ncbi:hypothetical protein E3E35_01270 [Thermococcus sp. GR7]|nr:MULTISPECIES: hypothetical protein [unclassified Thermococcus]NJE46060.1 hypothetical protein [Thermococcus sp. GR7]NJE78304.1 hypothetical protein [Thermococcus sp. GR4]NJF22257.1 hypothetical protein [Thermococcus sp. GR5]
MNTLLPSRDKVRILVLAEFILFLLFISPYLIERGVPHYVILSVVFLTALALKKYFDGEQGDMLVKSGNVIQVIEHSNFMMFSVVVVILLTLSMVVATVTHNFPADQGTALFLVLSAFMCFAVFRPLLFSRIAVVAVSLYLPHLLAIEMAGYSWLSTYVLIGGMLRVVLWVVAEATVLAVFFGVEARAVSFELLEGRSFNFFPLVYAGWMTAGIRVLDYFVVPLPYRMVVEEIIVMGAWFLSFYLLARRWRGVGRTSYAVSAALSVLLLVLLPPPL